LKHIRYFFEYRGLMLFLAAVRIIPAAWAYTAAVGLAFLAFTVFRIRRHVTLDNLRQAFPEKNERERTRIARHCYRWMGRMIVDFTRYPVLLGRFGTLVKIENEAVLQRIKQQGTGAVLISAHFGSWEMAAAVCAERGYHLAAIAGTQRNKKSGEMMNQFREMAGIRVIRTGLNVREVVRLLKTGAVLFLAADQDAGLAGVFVEFFGRPSSAPRGPALFALKCDVPMVIGMNVRHADNTYTLHLHEFPAVELSGDQTEDVRRLTQAYYRVIERYIRQYPEQWLWMHRRWKTKPPLTGAKPVSG
jgi:KDO2-lipid IV(A) lauroyltransferase